jgi:uncharacterized protein
MTDDDVREVNLGLMQQYQTLLLEHRFDEWIELWADDGICEFPFARPERPRILQGKAAILSYMTAFPSWFTVEGVDELRVLPGIDPNVVIVEMKIKAHAVASGKPYNQQFVIVAEARDGKLSHYREYSNPLVSAEALS